MSQTYGSGREATPTGTVLETAAVKIDSTTSWEFAGASGSMEKDDFYIVAISRGPVPRISPDDFGDISGCVDIASDPEDPSYQKLYSIKYEGDVIGMELFVETLSKNLDFGTETDGVSMIIKMGGPLITLAAIIGSTE